MRKTGKLYLVPTVIAEGTVASVIPLQVRSTIQHIRYFLVEDLRTSRRYLSSLKIFDSVETLNFSQLDKKTRPEDVNELMNPLFEGHDIGLLSESGCPGVADPGSSAVEFAHKRGIRVIPLVGPSSILLALMASGLNGQQFAFHGYLPIEAKTLASKIGELEKESRIKGQTQIFIETPYRSDSLFRQLVKNLGPSTNLCLAVDLTGKSEMILTQSIKKWKSADMKLSKLPVLFLFLAQ
jgi:16S rRNA (cytidine1402-2'-O)-methyltransferase